MSDKAERLERSARFWFTAGTVTLGLSLALLLPTVLPVIGEYIHHFLGALIHAFSNSPLTRF